ncbi:hypothetical protein K474DRAFT_1711930 [Panus rudis PR-1116 ss-1]|nr:hypothetical protein K474DRAFT_1711930 [Panus rudis PR-1116 ss-1]
MHQIGRNSYKGNRQDVASLFSLLQQMSGRRTSKRLKQHAHVADSGEEASMDDATRNAAPAESPVKKRGRSATATSLGTGRTSKRLQTVSARQKDGKEDASQEFSDNSVSHNRSSRSTAASDLPSESDNLQAPVNEPPVEDTGGVRRSSRPGIKDRRPGKAAGLEKRFKADITRDAMAKREAKEIRKRLKTEKAVQIVERKRLGIAKVAHLLDNWHSQENKGQHLADRYVPNDGTARSTTENSESAAQGEEFDPEVEDERLQEQLEEEKGLGEDKLEEEEEEEREEESEESEDAAAMDAAMDVLDITSSSDDSLPDPKEEMRATLKKKLSHKEKRKIAAAEILASISAARKGPKMSSSSSVGLTLKMGEEKVVRTPVKSIKSPKTVKTAPSGFRSGWRERAGLTPTPAPNAKYSQREARRQDDSEGIGGLDDEDVFQDRSALVVKGPGSSRRKQLARVVDSHPQANGTHASANAEASNLRLDTPGSNSKGKRRSKKEVPPNESRSQDSIEGDALKIYEDIRVKSTLLDYYGRKENPFELDYNAKPGDPGYDPKAKNLYGNRFINLLQRIINHCHPELHYKVRKSDALYKAVRQIVYTDRTRYPTLAISHIERKIKQGKLSKTATAKFVADALEPDGEAFRAPAARDGTPGTALHSPFIFHVFGHFLMSIRGTVLDEMDLGDLEPEAGIMGDAPLADYPVGALKLALCAVRYAFARFESGVLVKSSGADEAFSYVNLDESWGYWDIYEDSVNHLARHPRRFDNLIDKALAYHTLQEKKGKKASSSKVTHAIYDPSSD